ncbi:MAG: hypothetical protein H0X66_20885 [Verrucomicrobia bacterium]|nr:hypothetical protein [Verrucomicrobiota bacterium]
MNLAKTLEETDATATATQQVGEEAEPSNIINLPEPGFLFLSPETHQVQDTFVDHAFSALNEW